MRRRLLALAAFISCLILIVLVLALGPLVPTRVTDRTDAVLRDQILSTAGFILGATRTDQELTRYLQETDNVAGTSIGVKTPRATYLGRAADSVQQRWPGRYTNPGQPRSILHLLYPRFFTNSAGDRLASQGLFDGRGSWIVEGTITQQLIQREERTLWIQIGIACGAVLIVSFVGADILSRRITRPIDAAVCAAESMGRGNLNAVVPHRGPREIVKLGVSLSQLSGRIDRLLAHERDRAATLSHRLRTPLTVLRLEAERLEPALQGHPERLERLQEAIAALELGLDAVIRESHQTREDGVMQQCDAGEVLRNQLAFWSTLASAQNRDVQMVTDPGPLIVPMSAKQLGVVLDALISNIFRHTPAGVPYAAVAMRGNKGVTLQLSNRTGQTAPSDYAIPTHGSTGIGLSIARLAIQDAGGSMTMTDRSDGQVVVTILFEREAPVRTSQPRP